MEDDDHIIPSGPFKGKRIQFASTTGIDMFADIAEDFMEQIFGFKPGEYLITDESSLADFIGVEEMELKDIRNDIRDVYGVDVSDMGHGNLVEIIMRIHHARYGRPS
jgi:hypothetical protein